MAKELYFTRKNSEEIVDLFDEKLKKFLSSNYSFEIGYVPEGYNAAFLMIEDNKKDPLRDSWKIVLFKPNNVISEETITLDNVDSLQEGETFYEEMKSIDTNYEGVLEVATDLIVKYHED